MIEKLVPVFHSQLYGVSSVGKPKQWAVSVFSYENYSEIVVDHGFVGGKIVSSSRKLAVGKNIGKSNETTHSEQAILEAQSLTRQKIDEQYVVNIEDIVGPSAASVPLPMLAHEFTKRKKYLKYPCFVQPKLNGVRCLIVKKDGKCRAYSRGGKEYLAIQHILDECNTLFDEGDIFDGEIFSKDLTFQQIVTAIKNEEEHDDNLVHLKYWVYDYVSNLNYSDRFAIICDRLNAKSRASDSSIVITPTFLIENEQEIFTKHMLFVSHSYEGTMIRNDIGAYELKHRSNNLLKYKDFLEKEFEIVGGEESDGTSKGQCVFVCRLSPTDERTFKVRCIGPNEIREHQWNNLKSYIGRWVTVKYQTESDDGIPIFPVGIIVRDGSVVNGIFVPAE